MFQATTPKMLIVPRSTLALVVFSSACMAGTEALTRRWTVTLAVSTAWTLSSLRARLSRSVSTTSSTPLIPNTSMSWEATSKYIAMLSLCNAHCSKRGRLTQPFLGSAGSRSSHTMPWSSRLVNAQRAVPPLKKLTVPPHRMTSITTPVSVSRSNSLRPTPSSGHRL